MDITLSVAGTLNATGAGVPVGAAKPTNRTFVLGAGAVTGDVVALLGSTDGGTTFQPLIDKATKTPVVLTLAKAEAVIDDGCDHYALRRQAVGAGAVTLSVTVELEPSDNPSFEPIRAQNTVALTATFTAPRPIATMFVDRTITGIYFTPDVTIAADASNYFVITVTERAADGTSLGTVGTYSIAGGVTANVPAAFTLATAAGVVIEEGHSLAWTAAETGTATFPIGLFELTYR